MDRAQLRWEILDNLARGFFLFGKWVGLTWAVQDDDAFVPSDGFSELKNKRTLKVIVLAVYFSSPF